jgi:hypothetical protein
MKTTRIRPKHEARATVLTELLHQKGGALAIIVVDEQTQTPFIYPLDSLQLALLSQHSAKHGVASLIRYIKDLVEECRQKAGLPLTYEPRSN